MVMQSTWWLDSERLWGEARKSLVAALPPLRALASVTLWPGGLPGLETEALLLYVQGLTLHVAATSTTPGIDLEGTAAICVTMGHLALALRGHSQQTGFKEANGAFADARAKLGVFVAHIYTYTADMEDADGELGAPA